MICDVKFMIIFLRKNLLIYLPTPGDNHGNRMGTITSLRSVVKDCPSVNWEKTNFIRFNVTY
jgi:hypothetical protein